MKRKLIKVLYNLYKRDVLDVVIEDFHGEIPNKVSDPALNIIGENRQKVDKWILYQAYYLQRRIASSKGAMERSFGMLLQLKIMRTMLYGEEMDQESKQRTNKMQKDAKSYQQKRGQESTLDKDLQGVDKFVERGDN